MVVDSKSCITLIEDETRKLLDWEAQVEHSDAPVFAKAQALAPHLGAHYRADGLTEIGFWTPRLIAQVMRKLDIYLEVLTPLEKIDLRAPQQTVKFRRDRLNLMQEGEYHWGVIAGMRPGTRDQVGSFYWLRYIDQQGKLCAIRDALAYSLPYGVFGPAELYDLNSLQASRPDLDYFRQTGTTRNTGDIPRVPAPRNILQLHVGTASPEGTFEGLTRIYGEIGDKLQNHQPLTPYEESFVAYDAVQLLPVEPTIEFRTEYSPESEFFTFVSEEEDELTIKLTKPHTQDWGYDVPILGSSATNSAILGSLRPHEVVDFIATLHNFPTGPIQVIYDLVYGHADNQSELLLHRQFLKGPNMYGQDLNHQLPIVRAIFLEMQRRKCDTGADGIRVDGGQDFRFFNPNTGLVEYDNAYLLEMADVVQNIGGNKRLMFTIYEDGRPWPAEGWEDISTYRELVEMKPESYQWGPLIFAHNTPTLKGFWERKWRRVCEVMYQGECWITGCANHDTVRRGNQVDTSSPINWNLGKTLPEVLHNAYNQPAVTLWVYGFSPGLPMDFINALVHAPWMFFRNTDERYGVKVVSEEIGFLDWQVSPELYAKPELFTRLKSLGFKDLEKLRKFGKALQGSMIEKDYHLPDVAHACQTCFGDNPAVCESPSLDALDPDAQIDFLKHLDEAKLKEFALKFMEDCYEVCNVSHYLEDIDPVRTKYNRSLREFRHAHPWLRYNLQGTDRFNKVSEEGTTIFYGMRTNPDNHDDQVAMAAHMGGEPIHVTLGDWLQLDMHEWEVAIASPGLEVEDNLHNIELRDAQALLLKRVG